MNILMHANHYFNFGFNVTHISNHRQSFHLAEENFLKAPSHTNWLSYLDKRQSIEELHSLNWEQACGLGTVLKFNKLRALDIDECTDLSLIKRFLKFLDLPENYEWVIKSGSRKGFHIIFYADEHSLGKDPLRTTAVIPNDDFRNSFKHIELRWSGHLVLPPSVHQSYYTYEFLNGIPFRKPLEINVSKLQEMLETCGSTIPIYPYTSIDFIFVDAFENLQNLSSTGFQSPS